MQTDGQKFTVENLDQLHVLVSSAHKTTRCDMTYTVLKVKLKTQINKQITLNVKGVLKSKKILCLRKSLTMRSVFIDFTP